MLYPPSYFLFQLEQACSTCLILACSRIAADQQVSSTVLDLFVSFIDVFMSNWKPTSIQKSCRLPPGLPWPSLCMVVSPSWVSLGQQWVQMVVWCQVIWVPWVFHFDYYQQIITIELISLLSTILKSNDFSGLCACPYWNFQACLFIFRAQSCDWIGHICDLNLGFAT